MAARDMARLERMKAAGNSEAGLILILDLIKTCKELGTGELLDDITLAFGIRSERDHDEILAGVIEDMLSQLMPIILKMSYSGMPGNFFDGLSFHVSVQTRLDTAIFTHHRWNKTWPTRVKLSQEWKEALQDAESYTYRDDEGKEYAVRLIYAEADLEHIEVE